MKKKYELVFTKEFLRRLKNLDRQAQIRILRELKVLEKQPFAGKQLVGHLSGLMSFRIGEYRVIYQLLAEKIIIRTVGHRRTIYKK